jgi:hypothetical protein
MEEKPETLEDLIKIIEKQNFISVEQFNKLKKFSLVPGGFSAGNEKSNENQKIIYKTLLNMNEDENVNFFSNYKKHPSGKISEVFQDKIDNKNSSEEIIVLSKDIPRCIFHKWKENNKDIDYELNVFQTQLEEFLKENKNKYSYYQGYLDFSVFFYNLFYDKNKKESNLNDYMNTIKLFTELYLKDYISPFKAIGNQDDIIFENSLTLLTDIIKIMDKNIFTILEEDKSPLCLCLSWVITLFTHEINNFYVIRRIMDYLLINEPINVYVLTAMIIVKNFQKKIKNILEAEKEEIFLAIQKIDLNSIDFNYMIVECDKFIKSNIDEILYIQDKNENLLILLGDYNYRGIENIVYSYNKQKLPERIIKKNKSFIVSYRFVFILFLVWIFVIFFFQKDKILKRLNNNQDLNMKANNKKNKSIVLEEDDF